MAERPIKDALPADLPENWQAEQIVAPTGEEVGLSHQHGYNYLMEMVNRAQRGVNSVNEAFESVSGPPRTATTSATAPTTRWRSRRPLTPCRRMRTTTCLAGRSSC